MFDKLISWIVRVIQGWYNWLFKKPSEEALRRKKICDSCPGNVKNFCKYCGCFLPAKQESPDETCLMNKW